MANNIEKERMAVREAYASETWKYKVDHVYKEKQIIAIYLAFKKRGIIKY